MNPSILTEQSPSAAFDALLTAVAGCRLCAGSLPLGPRPVLQIQPGARILVAGQAPGRRVHESGVPFDDPSGDRLREWMGLGRETFYDASRVALVPMGLCYPGTGKSGDLPPRPECATAWRGQLLEHLAELRLTLVVGQYAIRSHLPDRKTNLTETVRAWREYGAAVIPLPHPSPRNNLWLKKNPWFAQSLLPELRQRVSEALE